MVRPNQLPDEMNLSSQSSVQPVVHSVPPLYKGLRDLRAIEHAVATCAAASQDGKALVLVRQA